MYSLHATCEWQLAIYPKLQILHPKSTQELKVLFWMVKNSATRFLVIMQISNLIIFTES